MRGKRSMRAAASLAALATLLLLDSPKLGAAEATSIDPETRGLYGDPCSQHKDCSFPDAVCDDLRKICQCNQNVPISNYKDKCGKPASINEACMFSEQCEDVDYKTVCKKGRCACKFDMVPEVVADGSIMCNSEGERRGLYGDPCSVNKDCLFRDSVCDDVHKICQCHPDVPISNYKDKCGKPASINETCMFNEQCEDVYFKTECKNDRCVCKYEMVPEVMVDGGVICTSVKAVEESTRTLDPAMIGVLVGMAVMFIIICVVLQLFSRARWRENRTIFNTPNPRLMNVSLLRDSKLLHSQDRRGSRASVRPPSRQASQQDLRPLSPTAGSRRGSRASSGHSATSLRSATIRSPTTTGPTSVTVEIRAPKA